MARANDQVAAVLQEYAELITILGGDRFRARSYQRAARAVAGYHADVAALGRDGVRTIPGVGASIADKIDEILKTGTFRRLEELRAKVPPSVLQLSAIPTVGTKRAMVLYRELGVTSVAELLDAIEAGRLRDLRGFGPKSEENIRAGVELLQRSGNRIRLDVAWGLAERIVAALSAVPGCQRCAYAGSLRRGRETVGDIDVLAATEEPAALMEAFVGLPEMGDVLARGEKKTSVRTSTGIQVDLRVVPVESWGAALQYFTGSQEHNVRVREIAVQAGLKLSEYGLFDAENRPVAAGTEQEVYSRLGMDWVPPPLREDAGEVAAAREGRLPRLVQLTDLRGDLHTHTNLTDGLASLEEMVAAAAARGYEYYAVTDHAPKLAMHRMTLDKARAQREQLTRLAAGSGMRLLHGTELNIDPDGEVDWPAEILAEFDICVASVHSHFTLPVEQQTRRVIRACENPHVHVIGHLTGRLIGRRPPIDLDFEAVFKAAARTGTALEINGGPERLDLRDDHIRWAARHGVHFVISSDAHAVPQLDNVRYATLTAQRGWLTPDQIINTWPYQRLRKFLSASERRVHQG